MKNLILISLLCLLVSQSIIGQDQCDMGTPPVPEEYQPLPLCAEGIRYAPDESHPDHRPEITAYVNFHFILDDNGEGNFNETDNGDPNPPPTGPDTYHNGVNIAKFMIDEINRKIANDVESPHIPCLNTLPALDFRFKLEIYKDPNIPGDDGVFFVNSTANYVYSQTSADVLKPLFTVNGDDVIDVFILAGETGVGNGIAGVAMDWGNHGNSVAQTGIWEIQVINGTGGWWSATDNLLHEFGHLFNLHHTFNGADFCDDAPVNANCWNINPANPNCDELCEVSNNVMDYNSFRKSLTPCQLGRVHDYLYNEQPDYIKVDWCTVDADKKIEIEDGENITWDSPRNLKGDLVVKAGGNLTIQCSVGFPTDGKLIVERGGRLVIDGGQVTSNCGSFWKGIEVHGYYNKEHLLSYVSQIKNGSYPSTSNDHGAIYIKNGGSVENAQIGIKNVKFRPTGPDLNYTGGIIIADEGEFANNWKAIELWKFNPESINSSLRRNNVSYINECNFEITDEYLDPTNPFDAFITIWENYGINIYSNSFNNFAWQEYGVFDRGQGIRSINGHFKVIGYCVAIDPQTGTCVYEPNYFKNLTTGLNIWGLGNAAAQADIRHNDFENVQHGVYLSGENFSNVQENAFNIPEQWVGMQSKGNFGVKTDNAQGYAILANTMNTLAEDPNNFGIINRNTFLLGGTVDFNEIENIAFGIQTEDYNERYTFSCNTFDYTGRAVSVNPQSPLGALSGQGMNCDPFNKTRPTNNFLKNCDQTPVHIKSTLNFNYYENINNDYPADADCVEMPNMSNFVECNIANENETQCVYIYDNGGSEQASTKATSLKLEIDTLPLGSNERRSKESELMRMYVALDTSTAVILDLLHSMADKYAIQSLVATFLYSGRVLEADTILDTMSLVDRNDTVFHSIFSILTSAGLDNRTFIDLDSTEMVDMRDYANDTVPSSQYAQTVVHFIDTTDFIKDLEVWPSSKKGMDDMSPPVEQIAKLGLALPNPASESIRLNFEISSLEGNYKIQISTIEGKKVESFILNDKDSFIDLNVSDWSKGFYIFTLLRNDIIIDSSKFVIQ